ncbi:MAG: nucleoside recognition domain-containing protein [Bacillota bacterium]
MNTLPKSSLAAILQQAEDLRARLGEGIHEMVVGAIYHRAESLARAVMKKNQVGAENWEARLDDLLASRFFGYPFMLFGLAIVLWLTVVGANYPSRLLGELLFSLGDRLKSLFLHRGISPWWQGLLLDGVYRSLAWVVSVMFPPIAIFFPLFTLLEDLGYLPRVAFNLDRFFARAGGDGKQALTMAMGFGCNAVGVTAARIIYSPRERLLAMLTNSFVPCNGRFPTLIALATIFFGGAAHGFTAAAVVGGLVMGGVLVTFGVSWFLARTVLRGLPSFFALELPPYRRPRFLRVILHCVSDRIFFVLGRALAIAAPAGALTWLLAHFYLGGRSLLALLTGRLDPLGHLLGLDGALLLAFLLGLPANELVLPIVLMNYLAAGSLLAPHTPGELYRVLHAHGWTGLTAVNTMIFSLLHFPCGTTLLTMAKETGGLRWPFFTVLFNTLLAAGACFLVARVARLLL